MKKNPIISLFHPFTASAVGLLESHIVSSHSRPHFLALSILAHNGYDCRIEYFSDKWLPYNIDQNNINYCFHPIANRLHKDSRKWKKQWSIWAILAFILNTPSLTIINMSGHSSPFSMLLAKIILFKKKKYIAMLGGQHLTLDNSRIKYYKNASQILVHTNQQKKSMEKINQFSGCDIRVFPLGIDCTIYKPSKYKFQPNRVIAPKLLYVGRIVEWKQVHLAIEVLYKLKEYGFQDSTLTIIGPVSSYDYYNELLEIAQKKKLSESIKYEGFVAYDKLIPYYQAADMLLLPSDHETFGMVMIESMACGTPVAAIDCPGGPKEVIKPESNGILASKEHYSTAILQVFLSRDKLISMSQEAVETVISSYSIQTTFEVLKKSVDDCLFQIS